MLRSIGPTELLFFCLVILLVGFPFWRITQEAGYPGIIGLLALIPLLNIIFLYFLALSDWPIHRKLNNYKQAQ